MTGTLAAPFIRHPRGILIVTLVCFVALAGAAALGGEMPADAFVRDTLLRAASDPMRAVMRVVNAAGDYRLLLPGTLLLFVAFPQTRRRWFVWIALMLVAAAGPDVLKLVIGRPRPEETSMGFPSGHATAAAAYFGALIYLAAPLRPGPRTLVRAGAVVMILAVGVARVMLRAHWPSDVLGGVAFGLALASAAALFDAMEPATPPNSP